MKVIRVSNCDSEGPRGDQYVAAGPGLSHDDAEEEAELRNSDPKRSDEDFFRVVPDEYVLRKFAP